MKLAVVYLDIGMTETLLNYVGKNFKWVCFNISILDCCYSINEDEFSSSQAIDFL